MVFRNHASFFHTGKQKQKPFRDFLLGPIFDLLDSQDDIDHATYVCMQESKIRLAFASARLAPSPRSANALWMWLSAARSLAHSVPRGEILLANP